MWESISSGLFKTVTSLFVVGFVWVAFDIGKKIGEESGIKRGLFSVVSGTVLFAGLAAGTLGQASCDEVGDPLRGGCEEYADDGFTPTTDQFFDRLFYILFLAGVSSGYGLKRGADIRAVRINKQRILPD